MRCLGPADCGTTLATSDAGESPNKVRVKQLSDKLTVLQDELEQEKQACTPHPSPPSSGPRVAVGKAGGVRVGGGRSGLGQWPRLGPWRPRSQRRATRVQALGHRFQ